MLSIDERQADGVTVLDLKGRLVFGPEGQTFSQRIKQLVADTQVNLIVNMADVTFIDSCGVGELVSGFSTAKKQHGSLKLVAPTAMVREVLRIMRVSKIIDICDTE